MTDIRSKSQNHQNANLLIYRLKCHSRKVPIYPLYALRVSIAYPLSLYR